jgi:transketolase
MAIAEAQLAETFNRPEFPLIHNYTYCIVGDGCLQEGVAAEALSLAGHLKLSRLIVLYDDNKVQIDGETDLAFTENVAQRMTSYGFRVLFIQDGDTDTAGLSAALDTAKRATDRPTFIQIRTTIGHGSSKQGTEKVHGSPLGAADIAALKKALGYDPDVHFHIPVAVRAYFDSVREASAAKEAAWDALWTAYRTTVPEPAQELSRRLDKKLPEDLMELLPTYRASDAPMATRKSSENVLNAIADRLPELVGGSADLTASNLTRWRSAVDFQAVTNVVLASTNILACS